MIQSNLSQLALAFACALGFAAHGPGAAQPAERHLANVKQLTSGGENAEAYFSPDGRQLIYQTNPGAPGTCDQIFTMNVDGSNKKQLSKGGRTTCGYFFPGRKIDRVRVDASGLGRVPAAPELRARLRLADLRHVRHLPRGARRIESRGASPARPAMTPRPPSVQTAASSLRACATATWRFIR